MHKTRHLLLLLAALLTGQATQAQTQSPYLYDFNTAIDTSEPEFAPLGWGHLVDAMTLRSATYYVEYTYESNGGVDDSGCLRIGSQTVSDDLTQTQTLNDMLVLPPVGGTVSIDVKGLNYGSTISFYYINYEDGVFYTDGIIDMPVPALSETEFTTIELPEMTDGTLVGVRGNSVIIDNVKASTADVVPYPRMKVLGVEDVNPEYVDAASNGDFTLSYDVRVRNNGQRDLAVGDDNFSLSLINVTLGNRVVGTTNVAENLAMGAETTVSLTATMPLATYPDKYEYAVRDNLTGVVTPCGARQAYPYEAVAALLDRGGKAVGDAIDFGIVQGTVTYSYLLRNDGATPLDVTSVTITGGFSTIFKPQSIAPHATVPLPITFGNEGTEGNGALTIETNAGTLSVALKATAVAEGEMYANFEDGKMPAGFIVGEGWTVSEFPMNANILNNNYCAQAPTEGEPTRFYTPLLTVREGDVLHFDGSRRDETSVIRVYYSTNRKEWTLAHTVQGTGSDNNTFSPFNLMSDSKYSGEFRSYAVEGLPAGNLYVAFESGNARLDNVYGLRYASVAHDVMFAAANFPTVTTVNSESQASVTFVNNRPAVEAAGTYSVSLYRDGKKLATAPEADFLAGESKVFDLTFTPYEAGNANLYALFEVNGEVIASSDTLTAQVLAETSNSYVQIGEPDLPVTNSSVPVAAYYKHSESDVVYTAAQLGLKKGTRIKGLVYRGWNEAKDLPANLKVWMCNTDVATFVAPFTVHNTDTMQLVYDDTYTFPKVGNKENPVEMINITFSTPFVYDGGNLGIFMHSDIPSGYANVRFETDADISGQTVYRKSDGTLEENEYVASDNGAPVVTIVTESSESTPLTGVVTSEEGGLPVANATVTLTSGNVQYFATTTADGSYQLNVFKTNLSYDFRVEAVGYEPFKQRVEGFDQPINAMLKAGRGIYVDNMTLPETFTVNNRARVQANVMNVEAKDLEAGAWTASLADADGNVLATVATPALKAGEKTKLTFLYTPHQAGEFAMRGEFVAHGATTQTELFAYAVSPESTGGSVQVLDSNNISKDAVPLRLYSKNSESQTVYTADQLGIPAGAKIHRIAFKGYQNGFSQKEYQAMMRVYVENTSDDYDLGFTERDTTKMTRVYDGVLNVNKAGTKANPAEVVVVDLPEGFTYTGQNLRLAFHVEASEYTKMAFVTDKMVKNSYYREEDNLSSLPAETWQQSETPVMYLEVKSAQQVSGRVTNAKGEALDGVSVSVFSGDVLYTTNTDADGQYVMAVAQPLLPYKAVFALNGYETDTLDVNFRKGDVVLDHVMAHGYSFSGVVKGFNGATEQLLDGVTVKLLQGGRMKEYATNAEGAYTLPVRDTYGEFTLVFLKEKYTSDTVTVVFDEQTLRRDVVLNRLNTLSGTVYGQRSADDVEPLAGVSIFVRGLAGAEGSFLVETDEEGRYSVDIPAGNGLYGIYATKDGYDATSKSVTMEADDMVAPDIIMMDSNLSGINGVGVGTAEARGDVYTLSGKLVGRNIELRTLPKGMYVINGRKVAVK